MVELVETEILWGLLLKKMQFEGTADTSDSILPSHILSQTSCISLFMPQVIWQAICDH